MKPEEQIAAVAELCGWEWCIYDGCWKNNDEPGKFHDRPDYLNDLNAIHKAWRMRTDGTQSVMVRKLAMITSGLEFYQAWEPTDANLIALANASAAQRTEALLRTIGKWTE